MQYAHIAARLFNRPHLLEPGYARVLIGAVSDRIGLHSLQAPDGVQSDGFALSREAEGFQRKPGGMFEQAGGIAVLPIEGTLVHRFGYLDPYSGMTGYDGIQAKLEAALDDPAIRGILLDINSPGGEVSGCFDLAEFIYESRGIKPIWAVVDELCCSAAYALASAATRIVLPRTGQAGSIGVLVAHVDRSERLKQSGLAVTLIFAGDHKVDGNPFEPLPDSVRKEIQSEVSELCGEFVALVARHRGVGKASVRGTQSRVYTGSRAVKAGLADTVMPVSDVLPTFDSALANR